MATIHAWQSACCALQASRSIGVRVRSRVHQHNRHRVRCDGANDPRSGSWCAPAHRPGAGWPRVGAGAPGFGSGATRKRFATVWHPERTDGDLFSVVVRRVHPRHAGQTLIANSQLEQGSIGLYTMCTGLSLPSMGGRRPPLHPPSFALGSPARFCRYFQ